jgi:hypothetical protein
LKIKLELDSNGVINWWKTDDIYGEDIDDKVVKALIPKVTRLGPTREIIYRVNILKDNDGYIESWSTDVNGEQWMPKSLLDQIVVGASKIIDNHVIVDEDRVEELSKPTPTTEQQNVADLTLQVYQLQQQIAALGEK